jgi:hypothetical protein
VRMRELDKRERGLPENGKGATAVRAIVNGTGKCDCSLEEAQKSLERRNGVMRIDGPE